jgi:hypothetical protein
LVAVEGKKELLIIDADTRLAIGAIKGEALSGSYKSMIKIPGFRIDSDNQ